jgi:hypothetical protein
MSRITKVSYARSGSEPPGDGATEPIADGSRTGEVLKQLGGVTTDPSASPATPAVPPGRREGDPAQDALSKYQRISLALSAAGLIVSALGFTAVIFSIWTAQGQLSLMSAQTCLQVKDRSLSNTLALDRVFLDHPELRPYFYEGKDLDKADPLYPKVEAVADTHLDVYGYGLSYRARFPDQYHDPKAYEHCVRDMLALSPVMRRRLEKKAEWFSPELRELLKGTRCGNNTTRSTSTGR